MDDIEKIRESLKDRNLKAVARLSGVSAGSIYKLMDGSVIKPSYDTISKLKKYLNI